VVKDVFEFLQLLRFFLKLVDFSLVCVDSLVSFLDYLCLLLDFSLELGIGSLQPFDFVVVFSLLFHVLLFFLFFLRNLLFCDRDFTLGAKRCLGQFLNFLSILTLDFIHFFIFLFVDLFHCLSVFLLQSFDLLDDIFFALFLALYFLLIILL